MRYDITPSDKMELKKFLSFAYCGGIAINAIDSPISAFHTITWSAEWLNRDEETSSVKLKQKQCCPTLFYSAASYCIAPRVRGPLVSGAIICMHVWESVQWHSNVLTDYRSRNTHAYLMTLLSPYITIHVYDMNYRFINSSSIHALFLFAALGNSSSSKYLGGIYWHTMAYLCYTCVGKLHTESTTIAAYILCHVSSVPGHNCTILNNMTLDPREPPCTCCQLFLLFQPAVLPYFFLYFLDTISGGNMINLKFSMI